MQLSKIAIVLAACAVAAPATSETLSPAAAAAKDQLAAQLGVNPDDYSLHALSQLNCRLMSAHNEAEKARLLAGFDKDPVAVPGADAAQLAASIGIEPEDYTLSELVYIRGLMEGQNCSVEEAAHILSDKERISPEAASAKRQLAFIMGVEPQEYTLHELVKMKFEADQLDDRHNQ